MNDLQKTVEFLYVMQRFQDVYRHPTKSDQTPQSDAEHSWAVATNALILMPYLKVEFPAVDELKVLQMALLHDLAELKTGDTKTWDKAARIDKDAKEAAAAAEIFSLLPGTVGEQLHQLWQECEAKETIEAKIVKSLDRIDPVLFKTTVGDSWQIDEPEHATLAAFDNRQRPRHAFSKTMQDVYEIIRAKVQETFNLS